MTPISTQEITIATVFASSHRGLLTERELLSPQLKSRGEEITAMPVTEVRGSHKLVVERTTIIGGNSCHTYDIFTASQP